MTARIPDPESVIAPLVEEQAQSICEEDDVAEKLEDDRYMLKQAVRVTFVEISAIFVMLLTLWMGGM